MEIMDRDYEESTGESIFGIRRLTITEKGCRI